MSFDFPISPKNLLDHWSNLSRDDLPYYGAEPTLLPSPLAPIEKLEHSQAAQKVSQQFEVVKHPEHLTIDLTESEAKGVDEDAAAAKSKEMTKSAVSSRIRSKREYYAYEPISNCMLPPLPKRPRKALDKLDKARGGTAPEDSDSVKIYVEPTPDQASYWRRLYGKTASQFKRKEIEWGLEKGRLLEKIADLSRQLREKSAAEAPQKS